MTIVYFKSIDELVEIHKNTIKVSGGGALGILNLDPLIAAIDHIQNDDYYPEFVDKISHLFWVANKGHCFQDGNKRIAISICAMFLLMNGMLFLVQKFIYKMESVSLHVSAGNIDKELLKEIIHSIINEEDYNEELKIKLIMAFSQNNHDV